MGRSLHLACACLCVVALTSCSADTAGRTGSTGSAGADAGGADVFGVDAEAGGDADAGVTGDAGGDAGFDVDSSADANGYDASDTSGVHDPHSRCTVTAATIRCTRQTDIFEPGAGYEAREVHWQVPIGEPPAQGWPVVILFQGSFYSSEYYWEGVSDSAMGLYYRAETLMKLLDAGFAVLTPEAQYNGTTYWNTNIAPYATDWEIAPDHELMLDIFDAIEGGDFGELDADRLFAAGISSGGYMSSRMAQAYPGRFSALAILSASYCWCNGYSCWVPSLPDDHPPTLFVHGRLDNVVPIWTMTPYEDDLSDQGTPTRLLVDEAAGHHWVEQSPDAILEWFERYR